MAITDPSAVKTLQVMGELAINLTAAAIGAFLAWTAQSLMRKRKRYKRLTQLREAAHANEIALCIRIGGMGDPVPDVLKYLRDHQPVIKSLVVYRISSQEAKSKAGMELDCPEVANRILEDVLDGIRSYGQSEVSKLHFFPAGMIAYPVMMSPMINWSRVIIYHRNADTYVPLFELSKDIVHRAKNEFQQLKDWEVLTSTENTALCSGGKS